eukprot:2324017-Rhodomonas_salina.1
MTVVRSSAEHNDPPVVESGPVASREKCTSIARHPTTSSWACVNSEKRHTTPQMSAMALV